MTPRQGGLLQLRCLKPTLEGKNFEFRRSVDILYDAGETKYWSHCVNWRQFMLENFGQGSSKQEFSFGTGKSLIYQFDHKKGANHPLGLSS